MGGCLAVAHEILRDHCPPYAIAYYDSCSGRGNIAMSFPIVLSCSPSAKPVPLPSRVAGFFSLGPSARAAARLIGIT
jgi:hypothetical protein